ncbi:protein HESO1 [Impatiens glandulifera]|uniref:protein HESO1 n=1 Tax=Impatiens glandulifera TaxID=253017 RepID=UPI001FB0F521|nr:protein HESO1 [Impatiens glandulifera]XP_047329262.1 protein HESO1 [Impatiens glandulifera]
MSAYVNLEFILMDIIQRINPSNSDWTMRLQVMEDLRAVVRSVENLRGCTVEPYGSFVSNLFTKWGDLDISIELHEGSFISNLGKNMKLACLKDLQKALRRKQAGWRRLQLISHARVPILKTEAHPSHISCDISINNLSGQMKSKLLYWINEIDGRFRNMVLLVKEWAKRQGINDSKTGTLNSYSLSLLVIFHFQTCVPPLLPPLKEIYPGNLAVDLAGHRENAEKQIEEICAKNINRFRSDRSRAINPIYLSDLLVSFFAKFCDIEVKASVEGLSPYTGQWESIAHNTIWMPKTYALFVEDPFEQPGNSARAVSTRQLKRIGQAFRSTYVTLSSPNEDRNNILATLVSPQAYNSFEGSGAGPSHSNNGYGNRQQRHGPNAAQQVNNNNNNQVQRTRQARPGRPFRPQPPPPPPIMQVPPPPPPPSSAPQNQVWRPRS